MAKENGWKIDRLMCKGGSCPLRWLCKRYISKPQVGQKYFDDIPYDREGWICDYYEEIDE